MDADATRLTANRAVMVGAIHDMITEIVEAVADLCAKVEYEMPIEQQKAPEAFIVGFILAKSVYMASASSHILPVLCSGIEGDWRKNLSIVLTAINTADPAQDPLSLLKHQHNNLISLELIVAGLAHSLKTEALDTELGSGELVSDEDIQELFGRFPF